MREARLRTPPSSSSRDLKHSQSDEPCSLSLISQFEPKISGHASQVDRLSPDIDAGRGEEGAVAEQWSEQDEAKLLRLHNEWGNRWVEIGQQLNRQLQDIPRTDNTVKNHYYSRLRRGLRIINRFIGRDYSHKWRQLNHNVVSKVVQAAQELYRPNPQHPEQTARAYRIKNELLEYGKPEACAWSSEESQQLIYELVMFNRHYRKRCKHPENQGLTAGCEFKAKEMRTLIQQNELHSVTIGRRLRNEKERSGEEEEHPRTAPVKVEEQIYPVRQGEFQAVGDRVEGLVKQEQPLNLGAISSKPHPVLLAGGQGESALPVLGQYWAYPSPQFCLVSPYLPMMYVTPYPAGGAGGCSPGGLRGQTASSISHD